MLHPWTARILLTLLGVQVGLCTAFLAEEWTPLREREETAFRRLVDTRVEGGHLLDTTHPTDRSRVIRPLLPGSPASYLRIDITRNEQRPQDSFPQTSAEWAALLKEAREAVSPRLAAIDQPLSWENESDFMLIPLNEQVTLFDRSVLCVDLRRDPVGQSPPDYFSPSAIPLANLSGNPNLVPLVNRVVFHPSISAAPNILFGFRNLESIDRDGGALPAFARWDEALIPSFPVALAMARHRVAPEDVEIVLGSHIRLGKGPVISIDEFGRILLPQGESGQLIVPEQATTAYTTAEEVIDGELGDSPLPTREISSLLLTDATETTPVPWGGPAGLQAITNAVDLLPRPGPPVAHPRFPLWIESLLLLVLAALGAACLALPHLLRHLLGALLVLAGLGLAAALLRFEGSWTLFTPLLTCTILTWALGSIVLRQSPLALGP